MSTDLSRRAIVTGATALPVVGVLPTIADAAANPDAEIIALGKQLDAMNLPRMLEINWRGLQDNRAMEEHLESFRDDEAAWDAEYNKWWIDHPHDHDRLFEQADTIAAAILSIEPRTVAGLAVLARAISVLHPTLWHNDDEDFQYDNRGLRRLIEAVCDLAGVPYPPAAT